MSTVEQFTYTASPWGRSTPGWMTFQKSPGIEDSDVGSVSSYYRYGRPDGWDGAPGVDALSTYPVQFVFARPKQFDGDALLVQSVFTGERWYDPRPGDWFAHGFRIPAAMLPGEVPPGESVFRWFESRSLQREYPQELRAKATQISRREIPWEDPPNLPELDSLDDLEPNTEFDMDAVLGRIPDGAWPKLGAMLSACVKRGAGAKALVFDATRPESRDMMVVLLALMPLRLRRESQFATYFHAENAREVKADDTFLFYGTVRDGEASDPDTGLYGELPQGGLVFSCCDDVERFKQMIDACGDALGAEDFDSLVVCWKVASGQDCSIGGMRIANALCIRDDGSPRFKELHASLLDAVLAQLEEGANAEDSAWRERFAVARFELGLKTDAYSLEQFYEGCLLDNGAFDGVCQAMKRGFPTLCRLLEELERFAHGRDFAARLAERLVESDVVELADVATYGNRTPLAYLALKFREILKKGVAASQTPDQDIVIVEQLRKATGGGIQGMEEAMTMLRYKSALEKITTIEDVAERFSPPLPETVDVKKDILSRLKPRSPSEKVDMARAFDALGVSGDEYIVSEWAKDVRKYVVAREDNDRLRKRFLLTVVICALLAVATIVSTGSWLLFASSKDDKDEGWWESETSSAANEKGLAAGASSGGHEEPGVGGQTNVVESLPEPGQATMTITDPSQANKDVAPEVELECEPAESAAKAPGSKETNETKDETVEQGNAIDKAAPEARSDSLQKVQQEQKVKQEKKEPPTQKAAEKTTKQQKE